MEVTFATATNFIVFPVQLFAFPKGAHLFLICAYLKDFLTTSVLKKAFPSVLQAAFCPEVLLLGSLKPKKMDVVSLASVCT